MFEKKSLLDSFTNNDITFFSGVPDSLLSDFSKELNAKKAKVKHIISPNEGNALSIAIGAFITNNKINVVYLQNSGLGNLINPYLSLAHRDVWSIPLFFVIGWRGSHYGKDEPQHIPQGEITIKLLKFLKIRFEIVSDNTDLDDKVKKLKQYAVNNNSAVALIFYKKYISPYKKLLDFNTTKKQKISRIDAIRTLLNHTSKNDIIISTTGKTSRELYLLRKRKEVNVKSLYVVGGMGHASSIALGIMENIKNRKIFLLDGDGAILMHMGVLSLLGRQKNNIFFHILLNNESHDSVGGQPTSIQNINMKLLSDAFNYDSFVELKSLNSINTYFTKSNKIKFSNLLNIKISSGSEPNLPRPNKHPSLNFKEFKKIVAGRNKI